MTAADWADIDSNGTYREQNWMLPIDRDPFRRDPLRIPGYQEWAFMTPDMQARMSTVKSQIALLISLSKPGGFCGCKMGTGSRFNVQPFSDPAPLTAASLQAIVDLQTGHLYLTRLPVECAVKSSDWQYFLQFPIGA